ncbi:BbrUII/HgiDII family restriction enzyme [Pseudoxanthomonas beigongshangi]
MSSQTNGFTLELDLNVLNHLGIGLYSSTPAVVTEIVANAWDADAKNVSITIEEDKIIVEDDGHGMGSEELQNRFLRVGYARRDQGKGNKSDVMNRPVMGRKGIGKLAMFSLANQIDIISKMQGKEPVSARINVPELKKFIASDKKYSLEEINIKNKWPDKNHTGTKIILSHLTTGTDKTESYLRPRIARRFSILGGKHDFKVFIGKKEVTPADRGYQSSIQFLWHLDQATLSQIKPLTTNIAEDEEGKACYKKLDAYISDNNRIHSIQGFIATVQKPAHLKKTDDNMNQISLFANGRVFQEDMLKDIGNSKIFNNYLVGELHADFLDADDIDRATANRESVKQGDPLVTAVRDWLKSTLDDIADQWDEWRRQQPVHDEDEGTKLALEKWYETLPDQRDKKLAQRLVKPILTTQHVNDEKKNREIKHDLIRSAIVGFEKLRVRKQLNLLDGIKDVLSIEFQKIFLDIDDIEATYYHDITRSRLQVIDKFKDITDSGVLEKVAQMYLFEHLWLLDPTWDRVGNSEVMEQTLTSELRSIDPLEESGARLDIAYRTNSARHVIIELKRPGKRAVKVYDLLEQGDKYRAASREYFKLHPDLCGLNGRIPHIDVYFVTEESPRATDGDAIEKLRKENMQSFTYKGMIANANRAYHEYINKSTHVSQIDDIINNIK